MAWIEIRVERFTVQQLSDKITDKYAAAVAVCLFRLIDDLAHRPFLDATKTCSAVCGEFRPLFEDGLEMLLRIVAKGIDVVNLKK